MRKMLFCSLVVLGPGLTVLAADAVRPAVVRGRIFSVEPDLNQVTVEAPDGKQWRFSVNKESILRVAARPARLDDLKKGTWVRVRYDPAGGRNRVGLLRTPLGLDGVAREVAKSLRTARDLSYEKKEEYLRRLDDVVLDLDQRIEDLEDRVADKGEAARREHARELADLERRRAVVAERIARVRAATPSAWMDIKAGAADALDDLLTAYDRARSRIK